MSFDPGVNPYAPPQDDSSFTPNQVDNHVLARRGTRLGARLLDGLVLMAAVLPGFLLGVAGVIDEPVTLLIVLFAFAGAPMLGVIGYQWYLIATTGQTLGKKWLNIKIVKLDGASVDFVSGVIARNWVTGFLGSIPYLGALIGLVDILMIFGSEQRCLHDLIAGTKVVEHAPWASGLIR